MSKLFTIEVAEAIENTNIIELSERAKVGNLSESDENAIEVLDNFAREIGNTGKTTENTMLISELIKKTVEPLVFNPDDSILSKMFNMGGIGEFDEEHYSGLPKNTIKVYDAVRGGNVPKSYVDPSLFTPVKISLQAETELDYSDLRRNGWKSIVKMAELTREAMEQEMFYRLFAGVDSALDALTGDQDIDTASALTQANMDIFTRYINDWNDGGTFMVGLSKYIDASKRMAGIENYLSDEMKNELNRLGKLAMFDGVPMSSIPTARKTANGKNLLPDKRIFGIAGQIGDANMRGEMRMYETYDNDAEKVKLKFTGFEFEYVIYYLDKMARIVFA